MELRLLNFSILRSRVYWARFILLLRRFVSVVFSAHLIPFSSSNIRLPLAYGAALPPARSLIQLFHGIEQQRRTRVVLLAEAKPLESCPAVLLRSVAVVWGEVLIAAKL